METVYEEESDVIRTFLKIGKPKIEEKPYYDIDLEKNEIFLHDPIFKNKSDNSVLFEVNQIFTNEQEYSYIYEQICQNTISESLAGDSFVFISYGITTSEKLEMLIGNIENSNRNTNNIGIFPRLLDQLIKTINNNKEYKDNLSINLSYICIYDNKLIDLSNYFGRDFTNYNSDKFLKEGITIDNIEIIKKVKKVPTENYNDVLFFINKLLLYLRKIEDDSNGDLYSKSYISIIVYITNNEGKYISKITFLLLNGSEQLNDDKQNKLGKGYVSSIETKKILNLSKIALDTQYTYNSILTALKNNECINGKIIENNKLNEENVDLIEQKSLSRLTKALFYPCFSRKIKNIKFVIIGSILPLPGLYSSVNDTLLFLFECRKIKFSKNNGNDSKYYKKTTRDLKLLKQIEDDTIFNLEEKVKLQEKKIEELHNNIDDKIQNITALEKNYKSQINVLKECFGFKGDINILLSGYEFSKEMKSAKEIREAKDMVKRLKVKIKDLEEKLKNANEEIKKNNIIKEVKSNNETMLNYYFGAKLNNEEKINKENSLHHKIEEYQNELKTKDKIIQSLKDDLSNKNNILLSMPKFLKELQDKVEQEKEKENNYKEEKNELINNNNYLEGEENKSNNESKNIKIINQKEYLISLKNKDKEINEIKKRYENLLNQKEKIILDINNEINYIKHQNSLIFKKYEDEMIKLNDLFMKLINNYQRLFLSNFIEKCNAVNIINKKIQYDNILLSIKKEYDKFSFPLLYGIMEKKGIINITHLNSASLRRGSKDQKYKIKNQKVFLSNNNSYININLNEKVKLFDKNDEKEEKLNPFDDIVLYLKNQIKSNNIITDKEEIEKLSNISNEKIINEYQKMIELISEIENYINKVSENFENKYKNNKNINNINVLEYEKKIENYKNKIEIISNSLDKEIYTNNKNKIIINSQNRIIEKLNKDLIYKEIPEYKMKLNKKISNKNNLSNNKVNYYPNILNNNSSFYKTHDFIKNKRGFSSKIKGKRQDTEGSSGITSLIQKTNSSFVNNTTFMNVNSPIRIPTEVNSPNKI